MLGQVQALEQGLPPLGGVGSASEAQDVQLGGGEFATGGPGTVPVQKGGPGPL